MRITLANSGDIRTKKGFLWFPNMALNVKTGHYEVRWLEWATWEEVYYTKWRAFKWVENL